ncbi:unnamed protein product [Sphagnum tenellum]
MMMMLRRQLRVKAKIASMMNTLLGEIPSMNPSRLFLRDDDDDDEGHSKEKQMHYVVEQILLYPSLEVQSGYDTTQSKSRLDMWAAGHLQEGPASLLKVGDRLAVNLAGGLFSQILYEEDLRQDW